ncbi:hypothetical protein [Yoonia sp. 2307UL14-13]|uniref:hypothetical protein n=1 Tax=Yoonia sp. 2307UL14-13 TaxID=3126506 RepID=UPI00309D32F6
MHIQLKKFFEQEDGAVTVDFVVITSALAFLALLTVVGIRDRAVEAAEREGQALADYEMEEVPEFMR